MFDSKELTELIAEPLQPAIDTSFDDVDIEATSRLSELPPGPWRSLGGYLDYSIWADRERFLELDSAIRQTPPSTSEAHYRRKGASPDCRRPRVKRRATRVNSEFVLTSVRRVL